MLPVLLQMAVLIVAGVLWRRLRPGGIEADEARRVLSAVVFHLLLPALVLRVLWRAPLGADTALIAGSAAAGTLSSFAVAWLVYRALGTAAKQAGAMLLAATFGNVTYLGLPVLLAAYGEAGPPVAIVYDLFASTPLLFTLGIAVARRYGARAAEGGAGAGAGADAPSQPGALAALLSTPALWAAVVAVLLNATSVPLPAALDALLAMLGSGVTPLMLFAVGLGLRLSGAGPRRLALVAPTLLVRFAVAPTVVLLLASALGASGDLRAAIVLEASMPTMVLGLVLCDRYGLDTPLYALAVTVGTALSALSLPLWQRLAS